MVNFNKRNVAKCLFKKCKLKAIIVKVFLQILKITDYLVSLSLAEQRELNPYVNSLCREVANIKMIKQNVHVKRE